jgi:Holliday junction resolvase RusA-like endonuclease
MRELVVVIPGEPHGQGRPRSRIVTPHIGQPFVSHYDPPTSRSWKAKAEHHYGEALRAAGATLPFVVDGPVAVEIEAVSECPRSAWRKRVPVARRWRVGKPDPDNVVKAILDAGNALLWRDDAQVARLVVDRWTGAQGEAPYVRVVVRALPPGATTDRSDTPRAIWTEIVRPVGTVTHE